MIIKDRSKEECAILNRVVDKPEKHGVELFFDERLHSFSIDLNGR